MKLLHLLLTASTAAIVASPVSAAELVTNGGFETGDFSGFTVGGNTGYTGVDTGNAYEGDYSGYFGAIGSDAIISQDLATVAGQRYVVSFALSNNGSTSNDFSADFGGASLLSLVDAKPFGYTVYRATAIATSSTTTLSFAVRNDPSYYYLDAVSVQGVPEPATWALMITGFGLVGASMRKRSATAVFA